MNERWRVSPEEDQLCFRREFSAGDGDHNFLTVVDANHPASVQVWGATQKIADDVAQEIVSAHNYASHVEAMRNELLEASMAIDDPCINLTKSLVELIVELRTDARRYRYLREDRATEFGEPWAITRFAPEDERNSDGGTCPLAWDELDAAVDAAIQGETK